MVDKQLTNDVLQRLAVTETNVSIVMDERPQQQQQFVGFEKDLTEVQTNLDFMQTQIDSINKHINVFLSAMGTLLITIISVAATIIFR